MHYSKDVPWKIKWRKQFQVCPHSWLINEKVPSNMSSIQNALALLMPRTKWTCEVECEWIFNIPDCRWNLNKCARSVYGLLPRKVTRLGRCNRNLSFLPTCGRQTNCAADTRTTNVLVGGNCYFFVSSPAKQWTFKSRCWLVTQHVKCNGSGNVETWTFLIFLCGGVCFCGYFY